jgi:apolipoprotein D and lipocalin family protein
MAGTYPVKSELRSNLAAASAMLLFLAAPAFAGAPEPRRSLDLTRFMGRWHEIIRTPNNNQLNCHGAFQDWSHKADGSFAIDQVCHRDQPDGPPRHVSTTARVVDPVTRAKFEASFFGGLLRRQYWVIDHDDDYGWMIASTADGKFVALLARTPTLPPVQLAALRARMRMLGFTENKLQDVTAPQK